MSSGYDSTCSSRSRFSRSIDLSTSSMTVSGRSSIRSARSSMSRSSTAATISSGSMSASRLSRTSSPTCTSTSPSSSGSTRPHTIAALGRRQRFEQVADLGRRQGVDQPAHRAQAAAVERIRQQPELARGLVVADGFGHAGLRVPGEAASGALAAATLRPALCVHRGIIAAAGEGAHPNRIAARSGGRGRAAVQLRGGGATCRPPVRISRRNGRSSVRSLPGCARAAASAPSPAARTDRAHGSCGVLPAGSPGAG